MYHSFLIHSSADGHLGCFHVLAIINSYDSLWPHGLQHSRFPCPSLSPGVCSNSCPSSATPFYFCLQSFSASGSFLASQLFTSGGQSTGASTLASVRPMSIQGWFPLGLTGLMSLLPEGLSRVFSSTTVWKHQFLIAQPSSWYMATGRAIALTRWTVWRLCFSVMSRLVMAFLPGRKRLWLAWLQSPVSLILAPRK